MDECKPLHLGGRHRHRSVPGEWAGERGQCAVSSARRLGDCVFIAPVSDGAAGGTERRAGAVGAASVRGVRGGGGGRRGPGWDSGGRAWSLVHLHLLRSHSLQVMGATRFDYHVGRLAGPWAMAVLGAAHLNGIQLRLMGGDDAADDGWAWETEPPGADAAASSTA